MSKDKKGLSRKVKDRSKDIPSAIKAPATNLTLTTLGGTVLLGLVTVWDPIFKAVFGGNASEGTRQNVFIALVAAFTLITVADLLARAITSAARERGLGAGEKEPDEESADESPTAVEGEMILERESPDLANVFYGFRPDGKGGWRFVQVPVRTRMPAHNGR